MFDKLSQQNIRIIQDFISPGKSTLSPGESTFFSDESTLRSGETSSGEWAIGWNDRNSTGKPEPYQTNLSDIQWANLNDNQANWSGIQANPSADLPYV